MAKDVHHLERLLASERAWVDSASRAREASERLAAALREALENEGEDRIGRELVELDETLQATLSRLQRHLEERLNAIGDDAQLANVDLQNVLQKQQQTLQMLSNISKMPHDTATAVIRKIGG